MLHIRHISLVLCWLIGIRLGAWPFLMGTRSLLASSSPVSPAPGSLLPPQALECVHTTLTFQTHFYGLSGLCLHCSCFSPHSPGLVLIPSHILLSGGSIVGSVLTLSSLELEASIPNQEDWPRAVP